MWSIFQNKSTQTSTLNILVTCANLQVIFVTPGQIQMCCNWEYGAAKIMQLHFRCTHAYTIAMLLFGSNHHCSGMSWCDYTNHPPMQSFLGYIQLVLHLCQIGNVPHIWALHVCIAAPMKWQEAGFDIERRRLQSHIDAMEEGTLLSGGLGPDVTDCKLGSREMCQMHLSFITIVTNHLVDGGIFQVHTRAQPLNPPFSVGRCRDPP